MAVEEQGVAQAPVLDAVAEVLDAARDQVVAATGVDGLRCLAVGDFNGDRKPYIVLVNNRSDVCRPARIFYYGRRDNPFEREG
jgi:hypothetical protein